MGSLTAMQFVLRQNDRLREELRQLKVEPVNLFGETRHISGDDREEFCVLSTELNMIVAANNYKDALKKCLTTTDAKSLGFVIAFGKIRYVLTEHWLRKLGMLEE